MLNALSIQIRIDPNIGQIGRFLITWHGLFTAVGIATAVFVVAMVAKRRGLDEDDIYSIALWGIPGGIIGARGLYVAENWSQFQHNLTNIVSINEGGISVYGGLIGGALLGWGYARWRKLQMRAISDCAAFGMIMGQAIGRMGDLINGEHLAKGTKLAWGFCYTHPDTLAFPLCGPGAAGGGAVHPVAGLYEPALLLALFAGLLMLRRIIQRDGVLFWLYVIGYSAIRFGLSPLRTNESKWGPLTVPQWVAIATVLAAIAVLLYIKRLPLRSPQPAPRPAVRRPPARRRTSSRPRAR